MGKLLTPKEEIAALVEQEDALRGRIAAFEKEENIRQLSIAATKESYKRELAGISAELSPAEVVSSSKDVREKFKNIAGELTSAGEALEAAKGTLMKDLQALGVKRKALQLIEHQKKVDLHCQKVWHEFQKWISFYEVTRDHFYNTLLTAIEDGYQLDPRFHVRGEKIGLRVDVFQALDSLFRPGSLLYADGSAKLNLAQILMQLQEMRLSSLFGSEPYPEQDSNQASLWPDGENPQFSNQ